jgi:hypothetical protein
MASSPTGYSEPTARRSPRFWQFSLRDALLVLLVGCVAAAWWRERQSHFAESRRRVDAERRGSLLLNDKISRLESERARNRELSVLTITDPAKVHVKAVEPAIGSREGHGWAWRVHLPPDRDWWLYISQGERWDDGEGKYLGGAVSGSQIKGGPDVLISGCISRDLEGGAYVQVWAGGAGGASQAARFSDEGYAVFRASSEETRFTAGELEQQALDVSAAYKGRMHLFRWHRVRPTSDSSQTRPSIPDPTALPREYGFSIFLVDETPGFRPSRARGSRE